MRELKSAPLAPRTTLRLGGAAKRLVEVERENEIAEVVTSADAQNEPVLILGGGSNLVVGDDGFDGVVVQIALRGVVLERMGEFGTFHVAAGEPWDVFVERCIGEGYCGVECLAGIPGFVGATPIQNVGAYGQEVSETVETVRVFDREKKRFRTLTNAACDFSYRGSLFKQSHRYVVAAASFELPRGPLSAPIRYAELAKVLGIKEGERAPAADVWRAVLALRRSKGMVLNPDDPDAVSVGSFFVNPVLTAEEFAEMKMRAGLGNGESPPSFEMRDGRLKVPAAWLIEQAGFSKGHNAGAVGISHKHALALVHRGGGSARELIELARAIRNSVVARFGIELSVEPQLIGCSL